MYQVDELTHPYERFQTEDEKQQENDCESAQQQMYVYKEFRKAVIKATEHSINELTKRGIFPGICKDEFKLDLKDLLDNFCHEYVGDLENRGAE